MAGNCQPYTINGTQPGENDNNIGGCFIPLHDQKQKKLSLALIFPTLHLIFTRVSNILLFVMNYH